jgi:periplasmic protein TonB
VKAARGVGMGLDEKAMEAVRQYKFRPAMRNGKLAKVEMYVEVNSNLY